MHIRKMFQMTAIGHLSVVISLYMYLRRSSNGVLILYDILMLTFTNKANIHGYVLVL